MTSPVVKSRNVLRRNLMRFAAGLLLTCSALRSVFEIAFAHPDPTHTVNPTVLNGWEPDISTERLQSE